jgi:GT2 family glycosyltransferase
MTAWEGHPPDYAKRTMHGWQRPNDESVEVDLVGQAWFLRTEWLKYLFADRSVTGTNGEDIELAARAWRLEGIRSFCPPHPSDDTRQWGSTRGMELGLDEVASSHRVEHLSERRQIVEGEIAAGWKPLFMRDKENCKFQNAKCKLQIGEEHLRAPVTLEAESSSTALTPALSRRERDVVQPPSAAAQSADVEHYIQSATECTTRWVTQYSYPTADNGEATMPPRVSLRYIDATRSCNSLSPHPNPLPLGEGEWCVDCIDEIESLGEPAAAGLGAPQYDKIECGEALEHVRDPLAFLRRANRLLKRRGELTASVANARRQELIEALIHGRWAQEGSGFGVQRSGKESVGNPPSADGVPSPALRFYTQTEVEKLFYRAGFRISQRFRTCSGGETSPAEKLHLFASRSDEFKYERYSFTATPIARPPYELTSIIIITHNQLGYTRACLESIRFLTDEPYELIVVDNGSTDGTVDYLRSCPDVKLIENAENRGFPAAANQGVQASTGAQVLLVNNDVLVTTGWLRRMLEAMEGTRNREQGTAKGSGFGVQGSEEEKAEGKRQKAENNPESKIENPKSPVGLVGPLTNCASGYQEIPVVSYADTSCLDGFAWEHGKQYDGQVQEVDRLIGFCLLIRREVIDQIGLFDERFGIGNYEDDDYCRRAREAGWKLTVARDAFIHHFGHKTFDGAGVDLNSLLIRNRQIYDDKWATQGSGIREQGTAEQTEVRNPESEIEIAKAQDERPKAENLNPKSVHPSSLISHQSSLILSLCMIVRNNAGTIRPCLESIKPWVDEMIVVDTGSTDATPDICRELGAQVYHFPWPDSFSIARNESLKYARGQWIFWMDSDDIIDPENGRKLRELAYRQHDPKNLGYIMQVHCPGKGFDGMHDVTIVDHLKLFRNRPDLRFEGRIHGGCVESRGGAVG